jgi:RNA polymerase sigma factor (sigma-70 family)
MRDDPTVIALVSRAGDGDRAAWDQLVERYAPLVWSICRQFRLSRVDADDVGQGVWLRLVEHLPTLREPAALPGWIATSTRRECLRVLRDGRRRDQHERPLSPGAGAGAGADLAGLGGTQPELPEAELLEAELQAALRDALTSLPPRCQQLLLLLIADPPLPYAEIGARLQLPVGSIGPNRGRCLDALRRSPALAALMDAGPTGEEAQHVAR